MKLPIAGLVSASTECQTLHAKQRIGEESIVAGASLEGIMYSAGSAIFQLIAVSFVPATHGMTAPVPTMLTVTGYALGIFCMSRLFVIGMPMNFVIPLMTLLIAGGAIAVGMVAYHETPSLVKLAMLAGATGLLVGASFF